MFEEQSCVFQTIQIFIAARNLKNLDYFSKSDPFVKVSFKRDFNFKKYQEIGKTQTIVNDVNPTYTRSFVLQFVFQSRQDIKFDVYDDDGDGKQEHIGSIQTTLGALMGAKHQTSILNLKKNQENRGKLIVRCQKVKDSNISYIMKWRAKNLMNTDSYFNFWDRSDPYLKILKNREDNTWIPTHKTEIIMNDLNPNWKQFELDAYRIFSVQNKKFRVQCWDWQKSGKDQYIGEMQLNIDQLKDLKLPQEIPLRNSKVKNPGTLVLQKLVKIQKPNFIDYLRGGLELSMMIAIDFTASNGDPKSSTSLHHINSRKKNHYQNAIQAVGDILLNYDSDKKIPAFGFGANLAYPKMKGLSHCFPLSGDLKNFDCIGMSHLMELYKHALKCLTMSGPTYFGPIMQYAAKISEYFKAKGKHSYHTLMILTDGQIHDMSAVINLIMKSIQLPLSIIIVGVGSANFQKMQILDGDNGLFNSEGKKVPRDIVQFVPFRNVNYRPEILAKNLLAELPRQIVQYFYKIGVPPKVPLKMPKLSDLVLLVEDQVNKGQQEDVNQMMASMWNKNG